MGNNTIETVFKLEKTENEDILVKIRNGKNAPTICPYSQPMVIPDKYGIQVIPRICGSNCPLFDFYENKVILNCCGIVYDVEQQSVPENKILTL